MSLFQIIALATLAAFYAIYFMTQIKQRSNGIKTVNINLTTESLRDTNKALELIMFAAVLLTTLAELASISLAGFLSRSRMLPDWARAVGAVIGVLSVIVFWLATRTMKKNWRVGIDGKGDTKLVTKGIYSYSRNPAFLAFDLLFAGILIMFYNPVLLMCSVFSALLLHIQIMLEERYLKKTFGQSYIDYKQKVRRYFGRIKQ